MSKRIETGIEVSGNVDLIAVVETLRKNQLTEAEKKVLRHLYLFDLKNTIEEFQQIHDIAVYHSDVDCWPGENGPKKFLQSLYFFNEFLKVLKQLPSDSEYNPKRYFSSERKEAENEA